MSAKKTALPDNLEKLDEKWEAVMDAAKQAGFITFAYGGVAHLATHQNQAEQLTPEEHRDKLRMNGLCPEEYGLACKISCDDCFVKRGCII